MMGWVLPTGGMVMVLCFLGWLAGELNGKVWLRVPCALLLLPLVAVVPYALGSLSGSANTSIALTAATTDFMQTAADEIEAGNEARVLEEVSRLSEQINTTYEGGAFFETMEEGTRRLRSSESVGETDSAGETGE